MGYSKKQTGHLVGQNVWISLEMIDTFVLAASKVNKNFDNLLYPLKKVVSVVCKKYKVTAL